MAASSAELREESERVLADWVCLAASGQADGFVPVAGLLVNPATGQAQLMVNRERYDLDEVRELLRWAGSRRQSGSLVRLN